HAVKNLTTAEGGAIALNLPNRFDNNDVYKYLNIYSLHGQSKDALAKSKAGNWQYDVITPGYKANMTDISAAIGLIELKRYQNDTLPKRKEIFNSYFSILKKYEWAVLPIVKNEEIESSYHVFLLRIKNASELERNQIIQEIFKYEVSVNVHFQPLPMLTAYKNMGYKTEDYPIAMQNYKCEISLPVYYDLTNDQVETVLNAVIESVAKVLKK
ncbi:MAG TPA: DegT/DnrJ/EryC1/StrS family aminotransferase, partial [Bacteroidales bacterium]|nr:DegT/DnrJ/EryC1/StrS family aminotransferase [Bacteroidales bacterium]